MDGGRRLLRSVTGHSAGSTDAVRAEAPPILRPRLSRLSLWLVGRPGSGAVTPLERRVPRHAGTLGLAALFAAIGLYGAAYGGHLSSLIERYGAPRDLVARALGFGITAVTISGLQEMDEIEALRAAGVDPRQSLAFLDVEATRARLKASPLVAEASVRKLFPDRLFIDLTERDAYALWQKDGEVFLIGEDGATIDALRDARFLRLPFVVGEGANLRAREFTQLLEAEPEFRSRIKAGMLVGGRRWTLKLVDGIEVLLPEVDPAGALKVFADLWRDHKLSERGVLLADLRFPDRVVFRLTEEAAAQRREEMSRRIPKWKGA